MFDSDFDDALQYGDCMLRNKLLESDKEGTLEGDGTLDESQAGEKKEEISLGVPQESERFLAYALESSRVMANQRTYTKVATKFGSTVTNSTNFPNSVDPHARSRYLPPYRIVAPAMSNVTTFCSANVAVT